MVRVETLVIIHRDNQVLLGLKRKRKGKSFGIGKWNGYGGGLEPEDDGDLKVCVWRETWDEAKINIGNPKKIGETQYVFEGNEQDYLVHIYTTDSFEGKPKNSDEMKNHTWFDVDKIPYDVNELSSECGMWENDRFWMPYLLRGEEFKAKICMTADGETTSCVINGEEHLE